MPTVILTMICASLFKLAYPDIQLSTEFNKFVAIAAYGFDILLWLNLLKNLVKNG